MADWRVLLIGGSSGVGKTLAARTIARRFGCSVVLADDIRMAVQHLTTPEQQPALHYFLTRPDFPRRPPEELCTALVGVGRDIAPALEMVIAHHVAVAGSGPIVLEGDAVLPALAAPRRLAEIHRLTGAEIGRLVRAVFLVELEEAAILANMHDRGRGFDEGSAAEQATVARTSWLYGRWLGDEAAALGLPVLAPRPWPTLVRRILAAAGSMAGGTPPPGATAESGRGRRRDGTDLLEWAHIIEANPRRVINKLFSHRLSFALLSCARVAADLRCRWRRGAE